MTNKEAPYPIILGRYAGFFSRGAAWVIDRSIAFGITTVILLIIDFFFDLFGIDEWLANQFQDTGAGGLLALLFSAVGVYLLVSISYNITFWLLSGQTPGKRVLGVRVMRTDGTRLTMGNAVRRQIGYWISAIFYLGYLWILVDNRRRGFHDILAGTIVTYSWPEGRMRGTFVIERVQRFSDRRSKT